MKSICQPLNRRRFIRFSAVLCLLAGLLWASGLRAQTPEEHASHHPGQAGGAMPAAGAMPATPGATPGMGAVPTGGTSPAPAATPGDAGGMGAMSASGGGPGPGGMGPPAGMGPPSGAGGMGGMGDMGAMMKNMGAPKPKDFYPTLMDLPDLPLDKRVEVEQQAGERMHSGVALMNDSLDHLLRAASAQDYTAMQEGTASLREGLARFESGLAAQRALAEGKAPRNVALTWFKRDMNLLPLSGAEPRTLLGVTPFHLFTMVLLVTFALAMVAMYFFKMRRAAALFGRIEASKGAPPPGSAPELAGGKPPGSDKPPSGDKPPAVDNKPAAADKPAAPATKAAAPADKPAAIAVKLAADAPPKGSGSAPSAPAQERPAATKFECLAPAARAIFLAGTFNGWNAKATPMTKDGKGNWDVALALPPGRHEFKFVVDGVWCCEPGCEGPHQGCPKCVPNSSGTMNRFIDVTKP